MLQFCHAGATDWGIQHIIAACGSLDDRSAQAGRVDGIGASRKGARMTRLVPLLCLLAVAAPRVAFADEDIVIEIPGERSTENKLLLGGIAGAGFIAGALGAYFHLDSRSASDDVSSSKFTGQAWTTDDQTLVDRADRSRSRAIVGYSVGGALLIGAAVVYIITEPKTEKAVIRPHGRGSPTIAPTQGGAVLGGMWSF